MGCDRPKRSYVIKQETENTRARDIYLKYGFAETSEMCGNEIIAVYEL